MVEEEKLQSSNPDEEEEALSLSDLVLNGEEQSDFLKTEETQLRENEEEFNFGSKESEMCSADEVFFKGQILPLNRVLSRSESMDHVFSLSSSSSNSINSSRSSSSRSYYSSNSIKNHKFRNNFHSFPSPNPQIRVSSFRLSSVGNNTCTRTQKSTIWDLFRVGVVRAPEIELHDLKIRNSKNACVSRNSSSGSSSSNNCNEKQSNQKQSNEKQRSQKQSNGLLGGLINLSGCKCSVEAIETVPLNNEEELRVKKEKQRMVKEKREVSRNRTFEWLKELSHGSYVLVDDGDRRRIS